MPGTYFTLHFDETITSQIKKQSDILVRYYSDNHNEVRVRFLKVAVFGHAYAESVANELCETLQKFSLPLKYLLSLSYSVALLVADPETKAPVALR